MFTMLNAINKIENKKTISIILTITSEAILQNTNLSPPLKVRRDIQPRI